MGEYTKSEKSSQDKIDVPIGFKSNVETEKNTSEQKPKVYIVPIKNEGFKDGSNAESKRSQETESKDKEINEQDESKSNISTDSKVHTKQINVTLENPTV